VLVGVITLPHLKNSSDSALEIEAVQRELIGLRRLLYVGKRGDGRIKHIGQLLAIGK
jgi:hypothetical protein